MGNMITSNQVPGSRPLQMSNSLTSVLLDVLAISGCASAATAWEKKLVYWLVQHDQERVGLGCVGFDIEELGWSSSSDFAVQKQFVVQVIDAALARKGWDFLPFTPPEDPGGVIDALRQFRELVVAFTSDLVRPLRDDMWPPDELPSRGSCEVHRVYLHEAGCIICNDAPIDTSSERAPNRALGTA